MSYLFRNHDGRDYEGNTRLNKGGGGGGSSGVYYGNQDRLLGTQADIAQNMYNTYATYAPSRLDTMNNMVNEAMDGTLADRARGKAAADAGTALTTSLDAASRNLSRYGTTLNANALSANQNDAALMGAANRTGAMNRANDWAESQKWARNSDMYSTLQGMPGNATQALGSAASGYGQMSGQQNQVAMANAMGYGQMGGMIGYGLMAKDGGYIHEGEVIRRYDEPGYSFGGEVGDYMEKLQPGGAVGDLHNKIYATAERIRPGGFVGNIHDQLRPGGSVGEMYNRGMPGRKAWLQNGGDPNGFANGGYINEPRYAAGGMATMPKLADWRTRPTTVQTESEVDNPSPVGQVALGAAPALAMYGAKEYIKPAITEAWDKGVQAYNHAQNVAGMQSAADAELAAIQASQNATAETTASGLTSGTADVASGGAMAGGAEAGTAGTAAADVAGTAAADAAVIEAAGTATTEAAATEAAALAAAETTAATEAAATSATMGPVGWVAAAGLGTYALGTAMDWWADGGPVPHEQPRGLRKNMLPGGPVNGPGTATSDSIPAWLSNGEYVINADAVKEVGKDKLEKINEKGLKKRKAKVKAAAPKAAGLKKKPVAKK